MRTVYVGIDNSDNKLTQEEWSRFYLRVHTFLKRWELHGSWVSKSTDPWQNACWCVVLPGSDWVRDNVQQTLAFIAHHFRQDSIAWAEAPDTVFIGPQKGEISGV